MSTNQTELVSSVVGCGAIGENPIDFTSSLDGA